MATDHSIEPAISASVNGNCSSTWSRHAAIAQNIGAEIALEQCLEKNRANWTQTG